MDNRELKLRIELARKKEFFTHILIFSFVFTLCILIWATIGFGVFWPLWVCAAFATALFLEALHIGSLPILNKYFAFLDSDWEEKELQKRMYEKSDITEKTEETLGHL